jgi:hypothetical protein
LTNSFLGFIPSKFSLYNAEATLFVTNYVHLLQSVIFTRASGAILELGQNKGEESGESGEVGARVKAAIGHELDLIHHLHGANRRESDR